MLSFLLPSAEQVYTAHVHNLVISVLFAILVVPPSNEIRFQTVYLRQEEHQLWFLLTVLTFPLHESFRLPYIIFNKIAMTLRIFTEFIWLSIQNGVAGLL
jgi:hypothetical protein